jgi:large subunit ribosomal protein L4
MPLVNVVNVQNQKVGQVALDDAVYGVEVREHLYYEVVKMQLANRRAGNACTKGRAEVAFSTKKLYRQKGTGRARHGSRKAPTMVGGGTVFGPKPRSFYYRVPRSMRKAALRSALSGRLAEGNLIVVDTFPFAKPRTKELARILDGFGAKKALVVDTKSDVVRLSARNLTTVRYLSAEGVNVFDILKFDYLVLTQAAAKAIEGALKP